MKIWVQLRDHDEDTEFPEGATHDVLRGGVLKVVSGNNIHLYSPAFWEEVTIDGNLPDVTREPPADLRWQ